MRITQEELVEVAGHLAARGAPFDQCFLAFRRTGSGYIQSLIALRRVFPHVTLQEARAFFETRFRSEVLAVSPLVVAALRSSFAESPGSDGWRELITFFLRAFSPLAVAAHFSAAWGGPWRPLYEAARSAQPADEPSAAVTQDLLEEHGLNWANELAAIAPRI